MPWRVTVYVTPGEKIAASAPLAADDGGRRTKLSVEVPSGASSGGMFNDTGGWEAFDDANVTDLPSHPS